MSEGEDLAKKYSHPWRNYPDKWHKPKETAPKTQRKVLQLFLRELVDGWITMELPIKYRGKFDRYTLLELPDAIVATWLIHILRGYSGGKESEEEFN